MALNNIDFNQYDVVVAGAGFSGAVMAERFASQQNLKVLVVEQRSHIGGNCYDFKDENGIVVHKYGPHLFHTNNEAVWQYLSQFTQWHPYEHEVLTSVDNALVPLPFNLNTLEATFPEEKAIAIRELLIERYGEGTKIPILELKKTAEPLLKELAEFVYDKFFVNYTTKQWGCKPEDISPAVTARVPVLVSRDNRYFHDKYQAIPNQGYTAMFQRILKHELIDVVLNANIMDVIKADIDSKKILVRGEEFKGVFVFTGMLDELFDFCFGELPYRSLQFELETVDKPEYQPATTVNYPNDFDFTRITEFKHILPCNADKTTIVREYPQDYDRYDEQKNVPYYPIFNDSNQERYQRYVALSQKIRNLMPLGRLANYKYFNMDDAVANALSAFQQKLNSESIQEQH